MHSSRMRTARLLPVSPRWCLLPGGGWLLPGRGCLLPGGVSAQTPPHLWTEFLTQASENITLPQLRCGR